MKSYIVYVVLAIVILIGGYYISINLEKTKNNITPENNITNNELQITDEIIGTGTEAKNGNTVSVHYSGTLLDGKKFDSSYDRGTPFSFHLGAGEVIKGWDQGVIGMKVGGKRKLTIPPDLAYGSQEIGKGLIPANSTLVFEIELLKVE